MTSVYQLPLYLKLNEYELDVFEERAGIREFEGEQERWAAENSALRDMLILRQTLDGK